MSKIYASFSDAGLAEKAAGALLDYGVRTDDLSFIRSGNEDDFNNWQTARGETRQGNISAGSADFDRGIQSDPMIDDPQFRAAERTSRSDYTETRTAMDSSETSGIDETPKTGISTTTGADAASGAGKGAIAGLGIGIVAALAAVFIPGFGLILGGSALATAIGGVVATTGAGAVAGAVTGYLKDQGMDSHVAMEYEKALNEGGAMIEVNLPSGDVDEATAREVLAKYGAANVGSYAGSTKGYVS